MNWWVDSDKKVEKIYSFTQGKMLMMILSLLGIGIIIGLNINL